MLARANAKCSREQARLENFTFTVPVRFKAERVA